MRILIKECVRSATDVGDCLQSRYLPGQVLMAKVDLAYAYKIIAIRWMTGSFSVYVLVASIT